MGMDFDNIYSNNNKVIYYPAFEEHFDEDKLQKMINFGTNEKTIELISPLVRGEPFTLTFEK